MNKISIADLMSKEEELEFIVLGMKTNELAMRRAKRSGKSHIASVCHWWIGRRLFFSCWEANLDSGDTCLVLTALKENKLSGGFDKLGDEAWSEIAKNKEVVVIT